MRIVVSALALDCADPTPLSRFWHELLGGELVDWPQYGVVALRAPGITIDFTTVPETKTEKNRLHLDLATDDPLATVAQVLELGGTTAAEFETFTVMLDPEGNEFCVLHGMPSDRPWQPPT
ncbi:MAG: VOC family protein [Acidimicrobiales bacterium]|nr:VOC family protein [Acidimicrobiales bacterium]